MKNTLRFLVLAALMLGVVMTSAWAGGQSEPAAASAAQAKELTIAVIADAVTVDPHYGNELVSNIMFMHYYDPLVRRDADLQFVPALAESWEVKADQVTWVFKLRKGVKFHNGNPFTAADVAYTVERVRKSNMAELASSIKDVRVVDDHTVEIITPAPVAVLPAELSLLYVMDQEYTSQATDESLGLTPMGTGPYKLQEWVKEDHMTMVANEEYWGGAARIKKVTWKPITNNATRTAAILTGEVDLIQDLSVFDVDRVKGMSGIDVLTRPSLLNLVLAIDVREKAPGVEGDVNPMRDVRVRRAMAHAIDVESIKTAVMNGYSAPSAQYVPASHVGYVDGLDFRKVYPFDVEKAKALMKAAGWEKGFTLTLDATNDRYINDAQIAQALASQLAKININLKLNLIPKANFFGYIRVPTPKSSFIMSGWDVPEGDAGSMYSVMFYSRDKKPGYGVVNRGGYSNPKVDELVDKAYSTASIQERDKYLQDATRILVEDVPMIPVHYEMDIYAVKDYVQMKPRVDKFLYAYEIDVTR